MTMIEDIHSKELIKDEFVSLQHKEGRLIAVQMK